MNERTVAIQAKRLCKQFGDRLVLDRLDLTVFEGAVVALMGANGSGKTTLLRCLASVLRPTSGEVRWFGREAGRNPAERRLVGVVGHESFLYRNLTVAENLSFAARMCDVPNPRRRVADLLSGAGLYRHGQLLASQISRGTRQRVAILRALVHEPRIVLLDEPFSGLDAEGVEWLQRVLGQLRDRGCAICFTTHDERLAQSLADEFSPMVLRFGCLERMESHIGSEAVVGDPQGSVV